MDHQPTLMERPVLRGRLHQVAFVASVVGAVVLVRSASSLQAEVVAWVYGTTACLLYLTSSTYHTGAWSPRVRRVLQRADHCMIYVLIAGTFTPICVLGLHGGWRWVLLGVMWAGAVAGVVVKIVALERAPIFGNALYIVLGWTGLAALPALVREPWSLLLVVAAGLLYTVGAALFAAKRPRLTSRWFGYHEVWHSLGVLAGVLLFLVNLRLVAAG